MITVLCNCISLAMSGPELRDDIARALDICDYVFLGIFTLEMLLKWVAWGMFLGPDSYLHNGKWFLRIVFHCRVAPALLGLEQT